MFDHAGRPEGPPPSTRRAAAPSLELPQGGERPVGAGVDLSAQPTRRGAWRWSPIQWVADALTVRLDESDSGWLVRWIWPTIWEVVVWRRWKSSVRIVLGVTVLVIGVMRAWRRRGRGWPMGDEDDWLDADDYERSTGVSKRNYEQRLLARARSSMMGEWTIEPQEAAPFTRSGVLDTGSVDDVRLEGDGTDTTLVVLFHSDDRPGCLFGWRISIWPAPAPDDPVMGTPERWGHLLSLELVELVDAPPGLPACDPDADGITWIVN
jgi:hypothetical protein